jgi:hypothetical protein
VLEPDGSWCSMTMVQLVLLLISSQFSSCCCLNHCHCLLQQFLQKHQLLQGQLL